MFPENQAVFVAAAETLINMGADLLEHHLIRHQFRQSDRGFDGLLIAGPVGALVYLEFSNSVQPIRMVILEVAGRAKIMVGVGDQRARCTSGQTDTMRGTWSRSRS